MPTEVRVLLAGITGHRLAWRELFTATFEPVLFEPYSVGVAGVIFWNVGYFKGKVRWRS